MTFVAYDVSNGGPNLAVRTATAADRGSAWPGVPKPVEVCDIAEDESGVFVVDGGVTVPSGRKGSALRFAAPSGEYRALVKDAPRPLRKVAQDHDALYVFDVATTTLGIARIDKSTGAKRTLVKLPPKTSFHALAEAPDGLLVGTCDDSFRESLAPGADKAVGADSSCTISKVSTSSGAVTPLVRKIGGVYALRVSGDQLFFAEGRNGDVGRVALQGGAITWLAKDQGEVWSLDVDDTRVYFTSHAAGELRVVRREGGSVATIATKIEGIHAVHVRGDDVFVRTNVVGVMYEAAVEFPTPMSDMQGRDRLLHANRAALLRAAGAL